MKKSFKYVCIVPLVFLVVCGVTTAVWAIPITMQFTATDFVPTAYPAPETSVTGTIVWDATSVNSTIDSLSSIDLIIDGHTYGLGEVDYISPFTPSVDIIGGSIESVNGMSYATDDFWIEWNRTSLLPVSEFGFLYASSNTPTTIWQASSFTTFSITADSAPVPEPATVLLLGTGLVGFAGARLRKKFKK